MMKLQEADICEPSLPRRRKIPAHYELGSGDPHTSTTVEDYYHPIFFLHWILLSIAFLVVLTSLVTKPMENWKPSCSKAQLCRGVIFYYANLL